MFSTQSDNCTPLCLYFDILILFAAELEKPKIGILCIGLSLNIVIKIMINNHLKQGMNARMLCNVVKFACLLQDTMGIHKNNYHITTPVSNVV